MNKRVLSKKDKNNRLGRGLEALLGPAEKEESGLGQIRMIGIEKISPDKTQPRKYFSQEKIEKLARSIKRYGLLQPILVEKKGQSYQIIAGERRWRAAGLAGLHKIPSVLKSPSHNERSLWALTENLQREDLNPIEQARAFKKLLEGGVNQENLAKALGVARSSVANLVRLLQLDGEVQKWVEQGKISFAQARELLRFKSPERQRKAARACFQKSLTVKDLSHRATAGGKSSSSAPYWAKQTISELEKSLSRRLPFNYKKGKGRLTLPFQTDKELKSLLNRLLDK